MAFLPPIRGFVLKNWLENGHDVTLCFIFHSRNFVFLSPNLTHCLFHSHYLSLSLSLSHHTHSLTSHIPSESLYLLALAHSQASQSTSFSFSKIISSTWRGFHLLLPVAVHCRPRFPSSSPAPPSPSLPCSWRVCPRQPKLCCTLCTDKKRQIDNALRRTFKQTDVFGWGAVSQSGLRCTFIRPEHECECERERACAIKREWECACACMAAKMWCVGWKRCLLFREDIDLVSSEREDRTSVSKVGSQQHLTQVPK